MLWLFVPTGAVAVIVTSPVPTHFTVPLGVTVAMLVLLDDQIRESALKPALESTSAESFTVFP